MHSKRTGCLVCGKPLVYLDTAREFTCSHCGKPFLSHASCEDGHYICDSCHAARGVEMIMDFCARSKSRDPIAMVQEMMADPYIYMHGPEHHIMVGAALIAAYHNAGGDVQTDAALQEMKERGGQYPGGACGFWGCCGAAVSVGIYMSIVTGASPLSGKTWRWSNAATARALERIAALGGPRCCKRNSFAALEQAIDFTRETLGIEMQRPEAIRCSFSDENEQCLRRACPYYSK